MKGMKLKRTIGGHRPAQLEMDIVLLIIIFDKHHSNLLFPSWLTKENEAKVGFGKAAVT